MGKALASPGTRVRATWRRLNGFPGGKWLFSRFMALTAPYTGTIRARVDVLEPGFARVVMRDRHRVRNHLDSVHAVALANLAEMTSGLATVAGMPATVRGIPVALNVRYLKKARGTLTAESRSVVPEVTGDTEHEATAIIRDSSGDEVAAASVTWRLSPAP